MKLTVYLTGKNFLSVIVGVCVVGLAFIPLHVAPADVPKWQWLVWLFAIVGVVAILIQAFVQSHEDRKRDEKDNERDRRQDNLDAQMAELLVQIQSGSPKASTEPITMESSETKVANKAEIDGEVYRLVMSPRSIAWPLVRDVYRAQGRPDEAVIDTDILVEMYLVNQDANKTRYVREIRLSAEVNGKRVDFKRQDNLWADDFNDTEYEYGLKEKNFADAGPIKQLSNTFPLPLAPEQPVEGWVRFMAKEINADKITQGTITVTVVDSLGNEYPINKVAIDRERHGEIGLRRRRS
jgi:hypothetical protein